MGRLTVTNLARLEQDMEDALAAASRVVEAQGPVAVAVAAWGAYRDAVRAPWDGVPLVGTPDPAPPVVPEPPAGA